MFKIKTPWTKQHNKKEDQKCNCIGNDILPVKNSNHYIIQDYCWSHLSVNVGVIFYLVFSRDSLRLILIEHSGGELSNQLILHVISFKF